MHSIQFTVYNYTKLVEQTSKVGDLEANTNVAITQVLHHTAQVT